MEKLNKKQAGNQKMTQMQPIADSTMNFKLSNIQGPIRKGKQYIIFLRV